MVDVLLATERRFPALWRDDQHLLAGLRASGIDAAPATWTDPQVRWEDSRLVVIRSTFDYVDDPVAFVAWAEDLGERTAILNPPSAVRWNVHKRYLLELAGHGVPTPATHLVPRGTAVQLAEILRSANWDGAVVKPAVANGAIGARIVNRSDIADAQAHLDELLSVGDCLIQERLSSIETDGERGLIFIEGHYSHAVRRPPALVTFGWRPWDAELVDPTSSQLAVAQEALAAAPGGLLYARVDLAPSPTRPMVMEVELIEPQLFFGLYAPAVPVFVRAVAMRLADPGGRLELEHT